MMSCLYPPPPYFFLFYLHIFFLPPPIWHLCGLSVGVWVMCFLPSASSRTASPVCSAPVLHSLYDAFLALLCLCVGWGMSSSVCSPSFHHRQPVCLPLSVLHVSFLLLVVSLVASLHRISHCYPVPIFSSLFLFRLCILYSLSVCHWIFTCDCLSFWWFSWSSVWFEMCRPVMFLFRILVC